MFSGGAERVSVGGDDRLDKVGEVGAYASHARGGPGAEKLDFVEQTRCSR